MKHGKRNARLPDLGMEPLREPTPAELCPPGEDHDEQELLDLAPDHRVFARRRYWNSRLIEFALVQQIFDEGEWCDVVRADTCHGEVHIHHFGRRGEERRREVIHLITDFGSISEGYDASTCVIYDHFESNVRGWARV